MECETAETVAAPIGLTVSVDSTDFLIKWQNPSTIYELARHYWQNYGDWHYDKAMPAGENVLTFYPNISYQFVGALYDDEWIGVDLPLMN